MPSAVSSKTSSPLRPSPLPPLHEDFTIPSKREFDVVKQYSNILSQENKAHPVAAIEALAELVAESESRTVQELLTLLHDASSKLAAASFNPISLTCGTSLFLRFLTLQRPPPSMSFTDFKRELVETAKDFVKGSGKCRELIAENTLDFIREGSTLLVHGYSRVVVQALLHAAKVHRRRFQVYVTESRPFGLGLKTHAILTKEGIDSMVILDSAVSYCMGKVDFCLEGAESVCESGGLVNYIGGFQMAVAAKAYHKPLYALAESFKFCRVFPLSQFDLPSSLPDPPLSFPVSTVSTSSSKLSIPQTPSRPMLSSPMPTPLEMSESMARANPTLDYTPPELVSLIISDLGVMSPSAVSDALLQIYGGE